ncbi:hypothetical protein JCGZ_24262 [Jatropha curcas]|uniref:Aminotransferase-like plant mobile domain-containing protein n=1 Tax=Jatropha curcas TaxID=180498 RepID=A0A067JYU1_JATCU|nr:hypothetical protein JCGZ_24262 [Jatropha curcas]
MKIPSRLGLIGSKDFNCLDHLATSSARFDWLLLAPIESVTASKIWSKDTFKARDYAAGLRCTQPRFPPAMCYALMERWNDCTHTFVFGFGEMTLTPADYTAIIGLRFHGLVAPLDARYQTATLGAQLTRGSGESNWQFIRPLEVWAYEYRIYPGGPSGDTPADSRRIPRYLAHCHHTFASTEDPHYWRCFLNNRTLSDVAELCTRSRLLLRGYWLDRYFLGERVYDTQVAPAQRRVPHAPPRHMCLVEGMTAEDREEEYEGSSADSFLSAGDYATYFSTRLQARLPEVLEYTQERKKHRTTAHYRAEAEAAAAPTGPAGAVLGDVPFPTGMEVVLDPGLGLGSAIIIPADLRQAPPPPQLDHEHATHISSKMNSPSREILYLGSGDWKTAEAPVSPVRCYGLTPDGGGSTSDEARGGGDSAGLLRGG